MPLVLDATVGGADSNAYATVAEFDAALAYRPGAAAALALTSDQKIQALVTATSDIDTLEVVPGFLGQRTDDVQALAWPRTDTDYADDELPSSLVGATIELALSYTPAFASGATIDVLNQNRADGNVKRKQVDVLETEWFAPRTTEATALDRFPDVVQRLLAGLVVTESAGAWGTGIVARGS